MCPDMEGNYGRHCRHEGSSTILPNRPDCINGTDSNRNHCENVVVDIILDITRLWLCAERELPRIDGGPTRGRARTPSHKYLTRGSAFHVFTVIFFHVFLHASILVQSSHPTPYFASQLGMHIVG
jgi:hypothetical protein